MAHGPEEELRQVVAQLHVATNRLQQGDSGPMKELYSHRDDATLLGALGGRLRGWAEIGPRYDSTAALFKGGRVTHENVTTWATPDLAYTVDVERHQGYLAGQPELQSFAYRVTHVFRSEDDGWKIVHRHADPLVPVQEADSLIK